MGRGASELDNRLRERRLARGLSQQELAARAGLTRQAVNAIESGRYVPNTAVAIRLARSLLCRVEELFLLPDGAPQAAAVAGGEPWEDGERVAVARVGPRLIAHPLRGVRAILEGIQPADGIAMYGDSVRLLAPLHVAERTAVLLGCDPSLTVLTSWVSRRAPDARLLWLHASSQPALDALPRGLAHIAGTHLPGEGSAELNVAQAKVALGRAGGLVVTYASWEQGLIVAPRNPKALRSAGDLARKDVRIVNREPGSGSRRLLDELLARDGAAATDVAGYTAVVPSHTAVARAVAAGNADAGIGLEAVARAFGLDFVPLSEVRFDLVIPHRHAGHPAVEAMLDVLQGSPLRRDLAALPGYSTSRTGNIAATFPKAA